MERNATLRTCHIRQTRLRRPYCCMRHSDWSPHLDFLVFLFNTFRTLVMSRSILPPRETWLDLFSSCKLNTWYNYRNTSYPLVPKKALVSGSGCGHFGHTFHILSFCSPSQLFYTLCRFCNLSSPNWICWRVLNSTLDHDISHADICRTYCTLKNRVQQQDYIYDNFAVCELSWKLVYPLSVYQLVRAASRTSKVSFAQNLLSPHQANNLYNYCYISSKVI